MCLTMRRAFMVLNAFSLCVGQRLSGCLDISCSQEKMIYTGWNISLIKIGWHKNRYGYKYNLADGNYFSPYEDNDAYDYYSAEDDEGYGNEGDDDRLLFDVGGAWCWWDVWPWHLQVHGGVQLTFQGAGARKPTCELFPQPTWPKWSAKSPKIWKSTTIWMTSQLKERNWCRLIGPNSGGSRLPHTATGPCVLWTGSGCEASTPFVCRVLSGYLWTPHLGHTLCGCILQAPSLTKATCKARIWPQVSFVIVCAFLSLAPTFPVRAKNTVQGSALKLCFSSTSTWNEFQFIYIRKLPDEPCPCIDLRSACFHIWLRCLHPVLKFLDHVHFEEVIFAQYIKWFSWWLVHFGLSCELMISERYNSQHQQILLL